jgi:hypothetical protein
MPNELSHAGCVMSTANAELKAPTGVGSSDLVGVLVVMCFLDKQLNPP